ncbi:SGNH/GDSL hydrolase family protein [Nostoc sp.]|uniref:SGNH/GDSL hydrolase family protein n=1 Tax=Nostoc sp. TaxID=1180 RepID=UPI002FFC0785
MTNPNFIQLIGGLGPDGKTKAIAVSPDGKMQFDLLMKIKEQTADYTIVASDNNSIIKVTTNTPSLVILPSDIFAGFQCILIQGGTGTLQFQEGDGANLISFSGHKKLAGINATLQLLVISNSDESSAVWQVIRGDTIPGAIAVLPSNFTEIFGHNFFDSSQLTVTGSNTVASVSGVGTNAFSVNQASSGSSSNYPATKDIRASGKTAIVGGGLSSSGNINLSNCSDFTQIFLGYHTYSGNTLQNLNLFGGLYDTTGNMPLIFENSWAVNSGVQISADSSILSSRHEWEDKNVHLAIITRNDSILTIYVDGVIAGAGTFPNALSGTGILYNMYQYNGVSAVAGNMALMKAGFYSRGVNASEVSQIDAYFQALLPADYKPSSLLSTDLWIYNSNSIGQGYSYGNANTPSAQMVKALAVTYNKNIARWYNLSLGGMSTTQMAIDAPTHLDPFLVEKSGNAKISLILHEGTNDIFLNNLSGTQAYNNLKSYWQLRKTAGVDRVFVATVLPRAGFNSTQNTARTDCNNLIRNSAVNDGATAIIDFDTNSHLLDSTNTTYYSDGTHPTLIGAAEMANTLAVALNTYI